jgi:ABC-type bacteriocin/lantibiotic exporter with double-glycine peptidase domain
LPSTSASIVLFAGINLLVVYVQNWQLATVILLSVLAIIVLIVNIRDARRG